MIRETHHTITNTVNIRFYEQLNDFLPKNHYKLAYNVNFKQPRSIKDFIESQGVPHTEVDLILVNGVSVDFDYQIQKDDYISVYPIFKTIDISSLNHIGPGKPENIRFVLDSHLGRLAANLLMLGFDTKYRNDYDDPILAELSMSESRILLSRDKQLLMRNQVTYGHFIRSTLPKKQLLEVLSHFDLFNSVKPFTRCINCNGNIDTVEIYKIESKLMPRTKKYYKEFWQCSECKKVYWKGSHFQRMLQLIKSVKTN